MSAEEPVRTFTPTSAVDVPHAPEGPLAGLDLAVEDVFDVAGFPPGGGVPAGALVRSVSRSAPALQALLDAGARLVGRAYTDAFGRTLDGAARGQGSRASSSQAALAVSEGRCDVALCADVKGSVMASTGHLGLFGLRCTQARVTLQGCVTPAPSLIAAGLVAREAGPLLRVAALLLGIDEDPLPARPRLLLAADGFALLEPETRERFALLLHRIEAAHGPAELVESAAEGAEVLTHALDVLHGHEAWNSHAALIDRLDPALGAWIGGERWSAARALTRAEVSRAARRQAAFKARLTQLIARDAVLLLPTLPGQSQRVPSGDHGGLSLAILSGLPQVSIPLDEGALSLSLIGPARSDLSLVRCAARIHGEL